MGHYDIKLVALSYLVSVLGSASALSSARQISGASDASRKFWIANAAFAMGGIAIWSMHFIGMVAFKMNIPVSYGVGLTLVSLAIAILATGLGFFVVERARNARGYLLGGVIMGFGISTMHYVGMAAMRMPAEVSYSWGMVALSVLVGITASSVGLWLCFNSKNLLQRAAGAPVMGVAVCGMHYVGMAAVTMTQTDEILPLSAQALTGDALAYLVFLFAVLMLSVQLGTAAGRRAEQAA